MFSMPGLATYLLIFRWFGALRSHCPSAIADLCALPKHLRRDMGIEYMHCHNPNDWRTFK